MLRGDPDQCGATGDFYADGGILPSPSMSPVVIMLPVFVYAVAVGSLLLYVLVSKATATRER
ncbi:MAG TPA: hypothetical protein VF022_09035 [Rhodanobacteraceae bacterium]|jgi:hypothetical protein